MNIRAMGRVSAIEGLTRLRHNEIPDSGFPIPDSTDIPILESAGRDARDAQWGGGLAGRRRSVVTASVSWDGHDPVAPFQPFWANQTGPSRP